MFFAEQLGFYFFPRLEFCVKKYHPKVRDDCYDSSFTAVFVTHYGLYDGHSTQPLSLNKRKLRLNQLKKKIIDAQNYTSDNLHTSQVLQTND